MCYFPFEFKYFFTTSESEKWKENQNFFYIKIIEFFQKITKSFEEKC